MTRIISLIVIFFLNFTAFAETDITEYIIAEDYRALERALQEGVNPNMFSKLKIIPYKVPLLSYAAYFSDAQTLSIMLRHLANPNAPADTGETPIMFAVMSCKYTIYVTSPCEEKIVVLLKHDADPFVKDKKGESAESLANGKYKEYVSDRIRMYFKNAKLE
jgi:hypothetical protein